MKPLQILTLLLCLPFMGCSNSADNQNNASDSNDKPEAAVVSSRVLKVLVVENKDLAKELTTQFRAHQEGKIDIQSVDLPTFQQQQKGDNFQADVLIYPGSLMPTLASANQIRPMTKDRLKFISFSKWLRFEQLVGQWKKQTWGISLGSHFRVLVCNEASAKKLETCTSQALAENSDSLYFADNHQSLAENLLLAAMPQLRTRTQVDVLMNRFDGSSKILSPAYSKTLSTWKKASLAKSSTSNWWVNNSDRIGFVDPFKKVAESDQLPEDWKVLPILGAVNHYDEFQKKWVPAAEDNPKPVLIFPGLVASINKKSNNERSAWKFLKVLSVSKTPDRVSYSQDKPAIYLANQVDRLKTTLENTVVGKDASRLKHYYTQLESGTEAQATVVPAIDAWPAMIDVLGREIKNHLTNQPNATLSSSKEVLKKVDQQWARLLQEQSKENLEILRNQN